MTNTEQNIITLDGPAGVGKTSLAKETAERLGLAYLDTGAMFRSVAWTLGERAADMPDEELEKALTGIHFALQGTGKKTLLTVNGTPIDNRIRTEEVARIASCIATRPVLRTALKNAQQALGNEFALVVEGRDMGTVVFPAAKHKFFLDATAEERAKRRFLQLQEAGETPNLAELTAQITERDLRDRNRTVAPLRPADDAQIIDTTTLDLDGVLQTILRFVA